MSAETVDRPDIKLHCLAEIGACFARNSSITAFTWHSMSLLAAGRTAIGLYPDGSVLTVPLGIGVILPSFHTVGNIPVEIVRLNSLHNVRAVLKDVDLSILGEIPSLLVDLVMSRPAVSSKTDSSEHKNSAGQAEGQRESWTGSRTWVKSVRGGKLRLKHE